MTNSGSKKFASVSSASVLALSVALGGGTAAHAQMMPAPAAPAPVQAAPTPTAPTPPANAEECALVDGTIVCAPGTDADGFLELTGDPVGLDIQEGAVVQGQVVVLGAATGTVDGAILTTAVGEAALLVNDGSNVVINGFIGTSGNVASGIETGEGVTITNNGTIWTTGVAFADGVVLGADSTFVNNGLVQVDGNNSGGVFALGDSVTVTNSVTGSIITSGRNGFGIALNNDSIVTNAGLIQTFGDGGDGVNVFDGSTVTNTGTIFTTGDFANGVTLGNDGSFTNQLSGSGVAFGDGTVAVFGNGSIGVLAGDNAVINSDGLIITRGDDGFGILTGDNASVTLGENSQLTTTGIAAGGVVVVGNGSIDNAGLIQTTGDGAIAVALIGDGSFTNSGTITAAGEAAVLIGGVATVTNSETGVISSTGGAGLEFAADGSSLDNAGIIEGNSAFGNAVEAGGLADISIINSGTIRTNTNGLVGVSADNGRITNVEGGAITGNLGGVVSGGTGSLAVVNAGTITGLNGPAVDLADGDDSYIRLNGGTEVGVVDGGDGDDLFAVIITDTTDRTFDLSTIDLQYVGFEDLRFGSQTFDFVNLTPMAPVATGVVTLAGVTDRAFTVVNVAQLAGTANGTVTLIAGGDEGITRTFTVGATGALDVAGDDAVVVDADGFTIINAGAITGGNDAINTDNAANTIVVNNGMITGGDDGIDGSGADGLTVTNTGMIAADDRGITTGDGFTLTNSGTIAAVDRAVDAGDDAVITNDAGGLINTTGDADTIQTGDNLTLVNNGTISNEGFDTKIIDAGDNANITNNGLITSDWKGIEGDANFTLINSATGRIVSNLDEAVEADGPGLVVINDGEIISPLDDAVDGGDQVTLTNRGLIQGGENDGMELNSGTITNFGIIESLGSDPNGDFSDAALTNRELDAGIDFDGGGDDAPGLVRNEAGGIIRGDIGINASSGNFVSDGMGGSEQGSVANFGEQTVVNFGTITANTVNPVSGRLDAVLLSFGDDEFQQWTGAVVNGWIDLEGGNDLFILEGSSSSVTGGISGGMGDDTAILAGTLDSDNFSMFETFQLGSALGGTLNDLVIDGNRALTGNVVHVGEVFVDLGVDSLAVDGDITLANTGTLTIGTPLDFALVGQNVTVFSATGDFTNQGATVNILDDDLLIDYIPNGALNVQVVAVNPVVNSPDPNIQAGGNAVLQGINGGTIAAGNLAALNALPNSAAFSDAIVDSLPSLSDGEGREIFETAVASSATLDRHLADAESGIWGQFMVRGASQDSLSPSAAGYDSDQLIFTVGGDVAFGNARVGVLASYADIENSEVIGNAPAGNVEIESYKFGAYFAGTFADQGIVGVEAAYLTGEVQDARSGFFGPIASGYDFDGFVVRANLGYDLLADEGVSLIPSVGFAGARISFDDAQETGGFAFGVERADAEFAELRGGLEFGADLDGGVSGFIAGTIIHDLAGDERVFTLTSAQLPTFDVVLPLREQDRFELAAGASIEVSENIGVQVGYLGDFASGYNAHSGRVSLRIGF